MNKDDIIRMAREAGLYEDGAFFVLKHDELESFFRSAYAAGTAAEREACAQVCEAEASIEGIAQRCAAAIRTRGNP